MAGLQYYYFPTDFLYPRSQPLPDNNNNNNIDNVKANLSVKTHIEQQQQQQQQQQQEDCDENLRKGFNRYKKLNYSYKALVCSSSHIVKRKTSPTKFDVAKWSTSGF
ncbi:hypothetical protein ACFE04_031342 [Oxalis oulophora]